MAAISDSTAQLRAAAVLDRATFWLKMQDVAVIRRFVDGPLEGFRESAVAAAQAQCDSTQAILERQTMALRVLQGDIPIKRMEAKS